MRDLTLDEMDVVSGGCVMATSGSVNSEGEWIGAPNTTLICPEDNGPGSFGFGGFTGSVAGGGGNGFGGGGGASIPDRNDVEPVDDGSSNWEWDDGLREWGHGVVLAGAAVTGAGAAVAAIPSPATTPSGVAVVNAGILTMGVGAVAYGAGSIGGAIDHFIE